MPKKAAKRSTKVAATSAPSKGRGGKRPGAGRPVGSGLYGCPTKAMRFPAHLEEEIKAFITKKIQAERKK